MLTIHPADTKQTRVVKVTVPTESFFNFFSPPKPPQEDDDDVASDIEERLELDYQLGEDIKEKLIPRAIDWFTGEALQYEELEDTFEGEYEDDDEDDDDDDDDDDEDDKRGDDEEDSDEEVRVAFSKLGLEGFTNNYDRMTVRSPRRRPPSANKAK